ncbi:MAG: response regulator transcription factor [Chitinophagaceae bacterium]|nr:response regulator transcription factor [Chitinophagaceae bacterium]
MADRIKVFHLEDYKILRDGIRFLLSQDQDIDIIGEARNATELLDYLEKNSVDVLILDIYLDGMEDWRTPDGFEICGIVTQQYPQTKVVAHSVYDDADRVAKIMRAGAMAFVSKKSGYEELIHAIKLAYAVKRYICTETSKKLKNLNEFLSGMEDTLKAENEFFSRREKIVLELMAKGYSSKDIAKELFISEKTVETHRKNMVDKACVKNTVELMAYASSRGFLKN